MQCNQQYLYYYEILHNCFSFFLLSTVSQAQGLHQKLEDAFRKFQQDPQLKHAVIGFSVMDALTGESVFESNAMAGLAPASCQKLITSVAALDILGLDYHYKTYLISDGLIKNKS